MSLAMTPRGAAEARRSCGRRTVDPVHAHLERLDQGVQVPVALRRSEEGHDTGPLAHRGSIRQQWSVAVVAVPPGTMADPKRSSISDRLFVTLARRAGVPSAETLERYAAMLHERAQQGQVVSIFELLCEKGGLTPEEESQFRELASAAANPDDTGAPPRAAPPSDMANTLARTVAPPSGADDVPPPVVIDHPALDRPPATSAPPAVPVEEERECPHCAERIKARAKVCRFCGRDVVEVARTAETPRTVEPPEPPETPRPRRRSDRLVPPPPVRRFLTEDYVQVPDDTKRPQNRCTRCGHTWFPRGHNVSAACPNCRSEGVQQIVRIAPKASSLVGAVIGILFLVLLLLVGSLGVRPSSDRSSSSSSPEPFVGPDARPSFPPPRTSNQESHAPPPDAGDLSRREREEALAAARRAEEEGRVADALESLRVAAEAGAKPEELEAVPRLQARIGDEREFLTHVRRAQELLDAQRFADASAEADAAREPAERLHRTAELDALRARISSEREKARVSADAADDLARAERALDAGDGAQAETLLERARRADPNADGLSVLERRVELVRRAPAGMVLVLLDRSVPTGLYVRKDPVTNAELKAWIDRTGRVGAAPWPGGTYDEKAAKEPVRGVFTTTAKAFAEARGDRLPTEAEFAVVRVRLGLLDEDSTVRAGIFTKGFRTVRDP